MKCSKQLDGRKDDLSQKQFANCEDDIISIQLDNNNSFFRSANCFKLAGRKDDLTPKQLRKMITELPESQRKEYERHFFPTTLERLQAATTEVKSGFRTFCRVLLGTVAEFLRVE